MTGHAGGASGCIFCEAVANEDAAPLVIHRGTACFVILNRFPYNSGHLMIVPRRHIPSLAQASPPELTELMQLTRLAELALTEVYQPQGLNIGINLGRPAGAGIVDHVHIHAVPRWTGDTNFMSVVGEVRVLPEELGETATRLKPVFRRLAEEEAPRA